MLGVLEMIIWNHLSGPVMVDGWFNGGGLVTRTLPILDFLLRLFDTANDFGLFSPEMSSACDRHFPVCLSLGPHCGWFISGVGWERWVFGAGSSRQSWKCDGLPVDVGCCRARWCAESLTAFWTVDLSRWFFSCG